MTTFVYSSFFTACCQNTCLTDLPHPPLSTFSMCAAQIPNDDDENAVVYFAGSCPPWDHGGGGKRSTW